MNLSEGLREARRLIKKGWCRAADARNAQGDEVDARTPIATSWCLEGAVIKAFAHVPYEDHLTVWQLVKGSIPEPPPGAKTGESGPSGPAWRNAAHFNDWQESKEPVLVVLDYAIEEAERREEK